MLYVQAFARDLASAGGAGMITPDLTPEEAQPWLQAAAEQQLDPVFLVAPSSTDQRLDLVTGACRGFVYAASLMGTTGAREPVGGDAAGLVRRVRAHTQLPVAVGLGVNVVTGVLLFAQGATTLAPAIPFLIKMGLVIASVATLVPLRSLVFHSDANQC